MKGNFAGRKYREIPLAADMYFAEGKFREKTKFANIAKISSMRKIFVIQYSIKKKMPLNRLQKQVESELPDEQARFRVGRGTVNVLTQVLFEKVMDFGIQAVVVHSFVSISDTTVRYWHCA